MTLMQNIKDNQSEIELVAGFLPVVGQVLSIRDVGKALLEHDYQQAAISAADFLPIGRAAKAIGKNEFLGAAGDFLTARATSVYNKLINKGMDKDKAAKLIYDKHKIDPRVDPQYNKEFDAKLIKPIDGDYHPDKLSDYVKGDIKGKHSIQYLPNKDGIDSFDNGLLSFSSRMPKNSKLQHEITHAEGVTGTGISKDLKKEAYEAFYDAGATMDKGDISRAYQKMSAHNNDIKRYLGNHGEIVARASELDRNLPIYDRIKMVKARLASDIKASEPYALKRLRKAVREGEGK